MTLAALLLAITQVPSFDVRVVAVRVDVLVSHEGRPVAGLEASDFALFDDGVAQQIEDFSSEPLPVAAILVLDTSSSVEGDVSQSSSRPPTPC